MGTLGAIAGVCANLCLVYVAGVFIKDVYKHKKEKDLDNKGGKK